MLVAGTTCTSSLHSCPRKFQRAAVRLRVQRTQPSTRSESSGQGETRVSAHVPAAAPETRRSLLLSAAALVGGLTTSPLSANAEYVDLPALRGKGYGKPVTIYPDYTLTETGLQYKDLRIGAGEQSKVGDQVVLDWDAYTIGYYGRIVQAKNLAKGGSFEGSDEGFLRFTAGNGEVIQGIEEALQGMAVGGIRRIIVPAGPLSYPQDTGFKKIGPVPTSFGGKRTLDFVMVNAGAIDKTLLIDIELLGIGKYAKARRAEGTWVEGVLAGSK